MGPGGGQGDVCCPLKGATILFCPFRKNDQSPPLFVRNQITFDFPSTAADLLRREKDPVAAAESPQIQWVDGQYPSAQFVIHHPFIPG